MFRSGQKKIMGEENRKIPAVKYPPPEPLPMVNYIQLLPETTKPANPEPPKLPLHPRPRKSPEKDENKFCFGPNQPYIIEKLILGEYNMLTEMVTDISNGGHKSKLLEKIIDEQIRRLISKWFSIQLFFKYFLVSLVYFIVEGSKNDTDLALFFIFFMP